MRHDLSQLKNCGSKRGNFFTAPPTKYIRTKYNKHDTEYSSWSAKPTHTHTTHTQLRSLGSVAGPVIQATGRSEFEDGLGSGDFVCLFSRVPEGRMTAVSSRSHASCRVWARTHQSHKATRHAARGRQDQFLTMRYNTGLTAAPASPLYGSPVNRVTLCRTTHIT
jgi:hypothetical protein